MEERIAANVSPGIDLAYERLGDPAHPPVLLIMGIAAQMVNWPTGFLEELLRHQLQVIRFDHRDSGRSTHVVDGPSPDLERALAGDPSSASYTLSDMAADTVGLLDALAIERAHLVGASLGGAIAQVVAIEQPERVWSLTSMMSTTGDPTVGQIDPDAARELFAGPPATTREAAIEQALRASSIVGSPGFPADRDDIAARAALAFDRDHDQVAIARQAVASVVSGDRTEQLAALRVPTLVLHGTSDRMCDPSGGRATAAAIPEARLVEIDGMGHDLPPALWARIVDEIVTTVRDAEAAGR